MHRKSKNTEHSRRGFFRTLLGNSVNEPILETEEDRVLKQRASVLALKYGKNVARLAKIGVKSPVPTEAGHFRVALTGTDSTGDTHDLMLEIHPETEIVTRIETEPSATQGNLQS